MYTIFVFLYVYTHGITAVCGLSYTSSFIFNGHLVSKDPDDCIVSCVHIASFPSSFPALWHNIVMQQNHTW